MAQRDTPSGPDTTGPAARIGEVIAASTGHFEAQSDELHNPPPLGAVTVVRDGGTETLALVTFAETGSIDPGRRAVSRGAGYASEEDMYRRHPEWSELLRSTFSAVIVAHHVDGRFLPYVPPRPPRVHAFVYPGTMAHLRGLASEPAILGVLASVQEDPPNDFIAAAIRTLASGIGDRGEQDDYLREVGRQLVHVLRGDAQRLQTVLAKIRPHTPTR